MVAPRTASAARAASLATARADGVAATLRSYAARGVFREFSARALPRQRTAFRFVWLTPRPIEALYDANTNRLKLIDVLPDVAPRSAMDRALREFIASRYSTKLPAHRRLSRSLIAAVKCTNEDSAISITLSFGRRPADSARQSIQLVSEIFQGFLAGPYHEYMVKVFDARED